MYFFLCHIIFLSVRVFGFSVKIPLYTVMTAECQNLKKKNTILNHLTRNIEASVDTESIDTLINWTPKDIRYVICWIPKYFKKCYCWYRKVVQYLCIFRLFVVVYLCVFGGRGGRADMTFFEYNINSFQLFAWNWIRIYLVMVHG